MSISDKLAQYLPAVDIEGPIGEKVKSIFNIMKNFCPDPIEDIFISDMLTPEGRTYSSVFLFSPNYALEAKQFLQQDCFDITPIKKCVYYYEIRASNYDFERATDQSVLSVTAKFDADIRLYMQASKLNCNFLKSIILTYLKTNLIDR